MAGSPRTGSPLHLQPHIGLSGDDLGLDSDAELGAEELREGEGGEAKWVGVPGLLVHHQLVFGGEGLHEPGQSVARVVGFVGVHTLLLLLAPFPQLVILVDFRIVEEGIWQVLQEQGPRSTSSFPACTLSIPEKKHSYTCTSPPSPRTSGPRAAHQLTGASALSVQTPASSSENDQNVFLLQCNQDFFS